jgi:hypothetical protein
MSSMQKFFSYKMSTMCGIPHVNLLGSLEDWISLRQKTEELGKLMMPQFSKKWMAALLPVLDQFVDAYKGEVNHLFWQSMVKKIQVGQGSGSYTALSGWINALYPYLNKDKENPFVMHWEELVQDDGPEPQDFPNTMSSAPVEWNYFGTLYQLHFHAGMYGMFQNPETLALSPRIGWFITHDPAKTPEERIKQLEEDIASFMPNQCDRITRFWLKQAQKELEALKQGKPYEVDTFFFYQLDYHLR